MKIRGFPMKTRGPADPPRALMPPALQGSPGQPLQCGLPALPKAPLQEVRAIGDTNREYLPIYKIHICRYIYILPIIY